MGSVIPIPKNMMIQSSGRSLSIDFFSDEEVQKIFQEISEKINNDKKRTDKHKRYFLLVEFLYRTGARIDEVLLVKPSDVNLATNSIRMKTLKQGKDKKTGVQKEKYRIIPLHADLRDVYMQYLLDMNISTKSEDPLFPMSRQVVDIYFKKMQDKLGFKIHAHKFRHTFAVKAIMDQVPLNVLQQWLGHSSVFTTSIYTQITGMDTSEFMGRVR
ncbi:tyrosine-type recombinase/integrase [Cuniculiplasma sp. SKW4]|uniref:tyrosine-type recombinase/integrase n=1 Tax=Cuniculiplasma sp. SKW4 TaxID=3400171 RepID=UPI003FD2B989